MWTAPILGLFYLSVNTPLKPCYIRVSACFLVVHLFLKYKYKEITPQNSPHCTPQSTPFFLKKAKRKHPQLHPLTKPLSDPIPRTASRGKYTHSLRSFAPWPCPRELALGWLWRAGEICCTLPQKNHRNQQAKATTQSINFWQSQGLKKWWSWGGAFVGVVGGFSPMPSTQGMTKAVANWSYCVCLPNRKFKKTPCKYPIRANLRVVKQNRLSAHCFKLSSARASPLQTHASQWLK